MVHREKKMGGGGGAWQTTKIYQTQADKADKLDKLGVKPEKATEQVREVI